MIDVTGAGPKCDPVPEGPGYVNCWFGLFTTGARATQWRRFAASGTAAPLTIPVGDDVFVYIYEHDVVAGRRQTYSVKYRRDLISILCTVQHKWNEELQKTVRVASPLGKYFWLTEVGREKWDGVL